MSCTLLRLTITCLWLGWCTLGGAVPAQAVVVTQLELTGGNGEFGGRFHRVLDRLLDGQEGGLLMGQYQPEPDIVSPITRGRKTYSLFTSGLHGAAAPSATISGSSIAVDLSSLFFGVSRGDSFRAWNIGGLATGFFNPDTSEFCISWEHLFQGRPFLGPAVFSLEGRAALAQVAIPAAAILFGSGLLGLFVVRRGWSGRFA